MPYWLRYLILILIILGIFFRFANLDHKVYWHDEAYTSLRISGYTKTEFVQKIFNGHETAVEFIQKYQRHNPQNSVIKTVQSLAAEEAQHPPLYYVMVRLWVQIFGDSVATTRSLSAIISLLAFPAIYWLCLELFESPTTAWISIALLTVSPLHVLYAQEARQFSLWTVTIFLSSATLLRAIRLRSNRLWGIYTVTLILGLYTFLFSIGVAIAHSIYVFSVANGRFTKTVKAYLVATITAFLGFTPWILIIMNTWNQVDKMTASAQARQSITNLIITWITNINFLFGDFWRYEPFLPDLDFPILRWGRFLTPFILILVVYSLIFIYRQTASRVWLFIFTLSGIPALAFILSDLLIGGQLSARVRYNIPSYIGIQLAVAYLLASQIIGAKLLNHKFWQLVTVTLISIGVISCTISSQAETWWIKGSYANPQIARIINQVEKPLLISSNYSLNIGDLLSLSHLLNSKVKMQLVIEPAKPKIVEGFSDIFLFNPSRKFKAELEKEYTLVGLFNKSRLWRLENKN
ncbi:glycosyltransferase family 39 protein [Fortiea sp. LEGE XX443]|uniref:glycosyltransferase family 39 protein n=1 Tax=Fortiea sp. LEGE XX443 TaxID=1828611 RepID=UPI001D151E91|nr:glycosyltransferase family 39 protein [Fortiea sp. LEGE XX443]